MRIYTNHTVHVNHWPSQPSTDIPVSSHSQKQKTITDIAESALTSQQNPVNVKNPQVNFFPPLSYAKPLTEEEEENIYALFSKLGSMGLFSLATRRGEIQTLGNKLNTIHPLAVWKYVLNHAELKKSVSQIKEKSVVWNPLLKEYAEKLKSHYPHNLTQENVTDFLDSLNHSADQPIDKNTDWFKFLTSVT